MRSLFMFFSLKLFLILNFFLVNSLCAKDFLEEYQRLSAMVSTENIQKSCAFYEIYPESPKGQKIKNWLEEILPQGADIPLCVRTIRSVIEGFVLSNKELECAQKFFTHRLATDPAKEWLQIEFAEDPDQAYKVDYYCAILDVMAFLIKASCSADACDEDKVRAIGEWLYENQLFVFPKNPYKNIDQYTYLSQVIDSRIAVCLGFTCLYLSLAQRLFLPLEIVTVPSHIYPTLTLKNGKIVNIETTAKGLFTDNINYMTFHADIFHVRSFKEVAGLILMNAGSVEIDNHSFDKALNIYKRASNFIDNEPLLCDLIEILQTALMNVGSAKDDEFFAHSFDDVAHHMRPLKRLLNDCKKGFVDQKGVMEILSYKDSCSREKLEEWLSCLRNRYPLSEEIQYRSALFYLEQDEPEKAEQSYHSHTQDPEWEFFLAQAYFRIYDMNKACQHAARMRKFLGADFPNSRFPEKIQNLLKQLAYFS